MASKEVIVSECDECGATESAPVDRRRKYLLPVKWVQVQITNWRGTELACRDLCPPCAKPLATTRA